MATYILDGYNVARHLLCAEELCRELEAIREALEGKLIEFLRGLRRRTRIVLVYDGASGRVGDASRCPGLEVRFARPPERADDLILKLCRLGEGEGDLHVVTSDLADIGNRVRGLRLEHWTSAEFAAFVEARARRDADARAGRADREKPARVSPADAEGWLREFGLERFGGEGEL
jgi:predicted RNA-binding protein with PIN domain